MSTQFTTALSSPPQVDQWLVGSNLMVAPIMTSTSSRAVYVPAGTWCDFHSFEFYHGPTTLSSKIFSINAIPMLVRVPSILYLAPTVSDICGRF